MEKNQHNYNTEQDGQERNKAFTGNQPGQQLPSEQQQAANSSSSVPEENVQHSESSFPKREGETLGTP